MHDAQNKDYDLTVVNFIDHPIAADPNSAQASQSTIEQFADMWLFRQLVDCLHDADAIYLT